MTVILAAWMNDTDSVTYDAFGDGTNYTGNLTIGSSKFTVTASNGNVTVNTNKFTVAGASGNTLIAGTLGVAGISTLAVANTLTATGSISDNTTISLFAPMESHGVYLVIVGSADNSVAVSAVVTNSGASLRINNITAQFFSLTGSGLQLQLALTAAGGSQTYYAGAIRLA